MKKPLFVVLVVAMIVLLGLTVYTLLFFYGNSTFPPCCPLYTSQTEADQFEPGRSRGFGMMGPGMMGPGMMGAMHVNIENEHDFLVHMIPHHQEAVDTAVYLRDNTDRPEMRIFAEDIIKTQSAEIAQMTDWLEIWYPDQLHNVDYQPMMRNLENLQGAALDRAFLEDMIPHHMTAVMMSQQLLSQGLADHEEAAVLARSIRDSQRNEIHMMMQWLSQWDSSTPQVDDRTLSALVVGGLLLLLVFLALAALLAILLISTNRSQGSVSLNSRAALDRRYVIGEISREDYLDLRRTLK
jgi:uncharacterized protein (DUF305 family)